MVRAPETDSTHEQKKTLLTPNISVKPSLSPYPPDKNGRKHSNTPQPHGFFLSWWQELLACAGFVAALIALFATLWQYRDKPSPDWPDWLSLNSIIAIYLVLLKSCVLLVTAEGLGQLKWAWFASDARPLYDIEKYDDATRGPWGAAALIWRLKTRHLLASLGALVTLLTLLVDPATQQIVDFYECEVPVHGVQASVPRTAMWSAGGNRLGPLQEAMTPSVKTAIDAGIAGSFAPLQAECLTGNCTWANEYSSLGWAGFCNDISEELEHTNKTFRGGYTNSTVWTSSTSIPGGIVITQTTNFSGPPWTKYAGMGPAPDGISKPANSVALDFVLAGSYAGNGYGANTDPTTGGPWADCPDDDAVSNETEWKCRGYGAARCYVFPATKTYNGTVTRGHLSETGSNDGIFIHSVDTHCITSSQRTALQNLNYAFEPGRRWLAYNSTSPQVNLGQPLNNSFPDSLMERGCQYVYWNPSVLSIQKYLGEILTSNVQGMAPIAPGVDASAMKGKAAVQTIYNYGDVSFARVNETIWNLTQALDNHVRLSGDGEFSAPAIGQVQEVKTCIRIRWGWMAYPAALVVLTLVFFVWLGIVTRPSGVVREVWKSSPLALLYHGLVDERQGRLGKGGLEGMKEMERAARRTVVRLGGTRGGDTGLEVQ